MLKVLKKIRLYGLEDEQGPHSLLAFLTIDPEDGLRWDDRDTERERESHTHTHTHKQTEVAVMVLVRRIPLIKFPNRRVLPPISAILSSGMFSHQETGFSWIVFDSDFYCFTSLEVSVSKYPSTFYISWDCLLTKVFAVMVMVDEQENQQRRAQHRLQHPLLMWRPVYQQQLQTPQQEASHPGSQYPVKKPRLFG